MSQNVGFYDPIPSGSFQSGNLKVILKALKKDGLSGELNISSRDGDGFIALHKGYIAMVFSPGMYAVLKENLLRETNLDEIQVKQLLEIQKVDPNDILESPLVTKGYLSREALCRILKNNSEMVIRNMLSWRGLYRFYEDSYSNIPEEMLIDIDQIDGGREGLRKQHDLRVINRMPYDSLFTSVLKDTADETKPVNERVRNAIENASRRLDAFKPKEIVIVVDENPATREILIDGLTGFDFTAEPYGSAAEALDRILGLEARRIPVVVITDLEMKGLSDGAGKYGGSDLLAHLADNYPYVPVIVVTSITDPDVKLKSLFMGASYFLKKPGGEKEARSGSDTGYFIEELSYYIWNVLKGRRHSIQKEEISFAEDQVIDSLLETVSTPEVKKEDVLSARILVADDEPNIREALGEYLREDGFLNIDLAENGRRAAETFDAGGHDVVIVDILMPEKDGIEVLKEVKTKSPNSQVIIITGNADKNSAIAAVRFGAFDYIEKPFDYDVLAGTVRRAVEKKLLLDGKA
jgi:CheY-like chemotaxis protein